MRQSHAAGDKLFVDYAGDGVPVVDRLTGEIRNAQIFVAVLAPLAYAIFAQERSINGSSPEARVAARRKDIAPLVNELIEWMKRERAKLSRHNEVAKAFDYMLKRIDVFTRFLEDGRICLSNNAAERQLRGITLGSKSWLFAGSDRGGERAAVMLTLIQTCRLHDVDPQAVEGLVGSVLHLDPVF